jgi:sensor histidine kinase YesM
MPPLLLQPLVENAIKHGIAAHPQGGILRIAIQGTSGHPILRVSNTGNPLDPRHPSGTGLGNLRERLALLPSKATLHLFTSQEWTIAELRFVG